MRHIYLLFLLPACCGCIDPLIPASAPATVVSNDVDELIHKFDAETYQPELPDCLENKPGATPPLAERVAPNTGQTTAPEVVMYTMPDCPPCARGKNEVAGHAVPVFRIVELMHESLYPAWVKQAHDKGEGFPFCHWRTSKKGWQYTSGWTNLKDFLIRYDKSFQMPVAGGSATVAHNTATAPAAGISSYPIRGSWWSGCDSWHHLTRGAHAGLFDPTWLRQLSWPEIQSLHSDAHEGRIKWQYVKRHPATATRTVRNARNARTGNCPTGGC